LLWLSWKESISTPPLQGARLTALTEARAYEVRWRGHIGLGIKE
jgi:hypothetical protein